ncbi:hypothetical protein GCM10010885_04800 [Alicyclobacillus cellulosilyticus]|uniref:Uncharacterized protein n=1 Tax=Alicyclobacillus cellulosilyticus TaxID=1003997 RepID=A0A917K5K2_9BACL|nr:hypothetical protein [Alicyclobacillus cellulosilyticus]GGI98267.1 hypothetical protein GCM10010885_04800 [Alicyclobacillus cellulosilyticus]
MVLRKTQTMGAVAACVLTSALATPAVLAKDASSQLQAQFAARYQQNQQLEAQLLQQAASLQSANQTVAQLKATVDTLNQQIAALYAAEQTLANAEANIPADVGGGQPLLQQRAKLKAQAKAAQSQIAKDRREKKPVQLRLDELRYKEIAMLEDEVDLRIKEADSQRKGGWKQPLDGALRELQKTILDLQASAIRYTKLWIQLAKAPSATSSGSTTSGSSASGSASGVPASVTGLAYATSSIVIPASGAAAVTDVVAVQPTVKDAAGNTLAVSGVYSLSGPEGAQGVSIDPVTGTVTVQPGATPGTYTVTFTQGGVSESVTLTVTAQTSGQ